MTVRALVSPPLEKWFQMASTWDFRAPVIMAGKVGNHGGLLLEKGPAPAHRRPRFRSRFDAFNHLPYICIATVYVALLRALPINPFVYDGIFIIFHQEAVT